MVHQNNLVKYNLTCLFFEYKQRLCEDIRLQNFIVTSMWLRGGASHAPSMRLRVQRLAAQVPLDKGIYC